MEIPTYKVAREQYNSGVVFTGMTNDGQEITDGHSLFAEAWQGLLHSVDATEELFVLDIPKDIEGEIKLDLNVALVADITEAALHAEALLALAPSLKPQQPTTIAEIINAPITPDDSSLSLASDFYAEMRNALRIQARQAISALVHPSFRKTSFSALGGRFDEAYEHIKAAYHASESAFINAPISDLLRMCNPVLPAQFDLKAFHSASVGTRRCIVMAFSFFSAYGAKVVLKDSGHKLTLTVNTKN